MPCASDRLLRWGASTAAELAAADEQAHKYAVNETATLSGTQDQQGLIPRHGVARQASNVGAQLQIVGRAAAKHAGRYVPSYNLHALSVCTITWEMGV